MFDDNNQRNSAPPQNLPIKEEPTDMFGDLDETQNNEPPNALEAGLLKKKEDQKQNNIKPLIIEKEEGVPSVKEPILGKIILIVLIGLLLAGIAIGGFWLYDNFLNNKNKAIIIDETPKAETTTITEVITPTTSEEVENFNSDATVDMQIDEVLFGEPIDSDKDGLDDVREKELGTNPKVSDTDKDSLIDGDEVIIWKTNPLNPDTDGDSYLDGEEINNGYSPLGSGKIFSTETKATSTTGTIK